MTMAVAGRPVETATAVEIQEGSLRRFSFMDFHRCLKKPPQRTLRLFHSYHRPGGGLSDRTQNRNRAADAALTGVTYVPENVSPVSPKKTLLQEGTTPDRNVIQTIPGCDSYLGQHWVKTGGYRNAAASAALKKSQFAFRHTFCTVRLEAMSSDEQPDHRDRSLT